MMKDILRNGAATIEFEANKIFSMYKDGIISEKGVQGVKDAVLPTGNLASDLAPKQSLSDLADVVGETQKEQSLTLVDEETEKVGSSKSKSLPKGGLSEKTMEDMGKSFHN